MLTLVLAEGRIGPLLPEEVALVSVFVFLCIAVALGIRFLYVAMTMRKKERRLARSLYFKTYCGLVRKNSENLNILAYYLTLSPFYHPITQALLVKAKMCTREILVLIDNTPEEFRDSHIVDVDTRREELLKGLEELERISLVKEN
ncbi:MAG: hypothetical protein HZC04_02000 [Candidatus Lloydbacteria bacterium]|nr:hypothetical protein [Candidatus Lloydbacteria bacterium]